MSETSVLVSRPMSSSFDSPPKIEVSRRMNVDLPQPESAATPITTGFTSIESAALRETTREPGSTDAPGAKETERV